MARQEVSPRERLLRRWFHAPRGLMRCRWNSLRAKMIFRLSISTLYKREKLQQMRREFYIGIYFLCDMRRFSRKVLMRQRRGPCEHLHIVIIARTWAIDYIRLAEDDFDMNTPASYNITHTRGHAYEQTAFIAMIIESRRVAPSRGRPSGWE